MNAIATDLPHIDPNPTQPINMAELIADMAQYRRTHRNEATA